MRVRRLDGATSSLSLDCYYGLTREVLLAFAFFFMLTGVAGSMRVRGLYTFLYCWDREKSF